MFLGNISNPNKKVLPCRQCKQTTHRNLVKCRSLPTILRKSLAIPENICQICLDTAFEDPSIHCKHFLSNRRYKNHLCPVSNKHFLFCKSCGDSHKKAINWFKSKHNPLRGFKNYADCRDKVGV